MNLRSIRSRFLLCKREKHEGEQKKQKHKGWGNGKGRKWLGGGGYLG